MKLLKVVGNPRLLSGVTVTILTEIGIVVLILNTQNNEWKTDFFIYDQ